MIKAIGRDDNEQFSLLLQLFGIGSEINWEEEDGEKKAKNYAERYTPSFSHTHIHTLALSRFLSIEVKSNNKW